MDRTAYVDLARTGLFAVKSNPRRTTYMPMMIMRMRYPTASSSKAAIWLQTRDSALAVYVSRSSVRFNRRGRRRLWQQHLMPRAERSCEGSVSSNLVHTPEWTWPSPRSTQGSPPSLCHTDAGAKYRWLETASDFETSTAQDFPHSPQLVLRLQHPSLRRSSRRLPGRKSPRLDRCTSLFVRSCPRRSHL